MHVPIKSYLVSRDIDKSSSIEELLNNDSDFSIVGKTTSIDEATQQIYDISPNLIIISSTENTSESYQLITKIKEDLPDADIILTSPTNEFLKAKELQVYGYLIQPIDKDLLRNLLLRYKQNRQKDLHNNSKFAKSQQDFKIILKTQNEHILIFPSEIIYCQAKRNETIVHTTKDEKFVVIDKIGTMESILKKFKFIKPHRSFLINPYKINEVDTVKEQCVFIISGKKMSISLSKNVIKKICEMVSSLKLDTTITNEPN